MYAALCLLRPRLLLAGMLVLVAGIGMLSVPQVFAQTTTQAGRATMLDAERAFWQSIDQASTVELKLYLEKFPSGLYSGLAKRRLLDIEEAARRAKAQADEAQRIERAREARRKEQEEEAAKLAAIPQIKDLPDGAFEFAVGQNWRYAVHDAFTQKVLRTVYWEVTATDEKRVRFDRQRAVSWDGKIFYDANNTYEPHMQALEFPLYPEKRWRSQHTARATANGTTTKWDISYRVVGYEILQLASGTFDCAKIEATGTYAGARESGSMRATFWYDHRIGQFAQFERTFQPYGANFPSVHERWELTDSNLLPKITVRQ